MPTITKVAIVLLTLCAFVIIANYSLDRSEKVRCLELRKQAETYEHFYLTPGEKAMCDRLGIDVL